IFTSHRILAGLATGIVALAGPGLALTGCSPGGVKPDGPAMVVGVPDGAATATSGPRVITSAPDEGRAPAAGDQGDVFVDGAPFGGASSEPPPGAALAAANGQPWPAPIPFTTNEAVPDGLVFILVAGSDARPHEDLLHTRADSLHLLAVNPGTGQGTLLGFPRDSWVEIPGHGRDKLNNALALGGPDLLAATVRRLTGLPVDYYVITGFPGLVSMVDELGGVDVFVDRRMNDRNSGARFQRGWHHFTGAEALAFSRDRTDVERGDLTRSEHQGLVIVSALAKMRAEVADDAGVARWIGVLVKHVRLDVPLAKLPALGALARRLDPAHLKNVVAPGRVGTTARQSVVFLTTEAARLFEDLRADAVIGSAAPDPATSTTTPPATAGSPASSSSSSSSSTSSTSSPGSSSSSSTSSSTSSLTTPSSSTTSSTAPNRHDPHSRRAGR
ncbi:MAG TPA: LCP family protein, partial [Acidimicrobiia bacterium]|nr:LCP family protein [Acidimicrobiia bacterium]